jgi:hypothetical protein
MHNKSRLPAFLRLVVPDKYLVFHSKRWDAYPHERSEMSNPGLGDDFVMNVESRNIPYRSSDPFPDNLMNLNAEQLALRKIVWIDIVDSKPQPDKKLGSLRGFVCPEGGIATPLTGAKKAKAADETKPPVWAQSYSGDMICAVRVSQFRFRWKGLQTVMEKNISAMSRTMTLDIQRKLVRSAGQWFRLTPDQGRDIERRLHEAMRAGAAAIPQADAAADDEPDKLIDSPAGVPIVEGASDED